MPIKLIIFDLDGVLVDSREMHYEALNRALAEVAPAFVISREEHLSTYDGLSTTKKLNLLSAKGLDRDMHNLIWQKKQDYTVKIILEKYQPDERIIDVLIDLKQRGFIVYVASNCIWNSIKMILLRKGYLEYIDYFISNEDVVAPKPSPEIYFKCMVRAKVAAEETIIVEDSHIGRRAAIASGANLLPVENPDQVSLKLLDRYIQKHNMASDNNPKWQGPCNVVIPMAGEGSRFANAGYSFPKPLIDVHGKPMIQVVVDNLGLDPDKTRFIFIVRKSHMEKYNISHLLKLIAPNCVIVETDGLTEGAACSILLAREYIDNDEHLLMANSDQFIEWDPNVFMYSMIADDIDGGIATFDNSHPKWSYAKLGDDGFVCEVAEKKPISMHATVGVYYWKHGSDFVRAADEMIANDIRVNGEFYTCPVFNEAIAAGKKIKIYDVERMWGIGVPEDLQYFLQNYKA